MKKNRQIVKINRSKNIPDSVKLIDNHLKKFFDKDSEFPVFKEKVSKVIRRDIYCLQATPDRPYHVLLSCGMSALPMKVPKNVISSEYAEVMMMLPKEWNLNFESFKDERCYWPLRIMYDLMLFPHIAKTWFGLGHTFANEGFNELADGIGFNSVILVPSLLLSDDFTKIKLENNKVVNVYSLIPLYKEEYEFKKNNSALELFDKFKTFKISEIVQVGRKNVCK